MQLSLSHRHTSFHGICFWILLFFCQKNAFFYTLTASMQIPKGPTHRLCCSLTVQAPVNPFFSTL